MNQRADQVISLCSSCLDGSSIYDYAGSVDTGTSLS